MRTPFPSQARLMRVRIEAICEWSVDENDVRLTTRRSPSRPGLAPPIPPRCRPSARARAVHHARLAESAAAAHPRKISTFSRSCTTSVNGTIHGPSQLSAKPRTGSSRCGSAGTLPKARSTNPSCASSSAPAVQRRHVPARLVGQRAQDVGARSALGAQAADDGQAARQASSPSPMLNASKNRRVGLRVVGAVPPPTTSGSNFDALVGAAARMPCQIERLKRSSSRQLVRQVMPTASNSDSGAQLSMLNSGMLPRAQRVAHRRRRKKRARPPSRRRRSPRSRGCAAPGSPAPSS